ncbi:ATP-binding protein [Micromonospora sp. WMMA1996]|uniref:FxSxx-COOH system tetratricopeptide repeat protein n=1 Tax=Micromonospora sp. WMMA1996 TaxID=2039878 RepID=UPI000BF3EC5C|nr:FxSxx-COOH system tetratricopeptide repeat protein [Micromonospora sp. WMMA1996]PGH45899.1 ATP-binding protein [Micromonospora sp. WMMA1996]
MTTEAGALSGEKLFISYAGPDRAWAEWVAWQLEQAGYAVELDLWDWAAGDNAVARMNQALQRADRMVALFSEAYFEHQRFTTDEWTGVMSRRDRHGRLVPLRLEDVTPPLVLRPLIAPSLAGLSAEDAHRVLMNAVRGTQRPATEPTFPGGQVPRQRSADEAPRLPGGHQPTLWQVPHRNADFIGRDRDIDEVRRRLRPGQPVVIHSSVPLGGVGKTQVAMQYVHRFAAQYDLVAWINAEDPQLVAAQLTALAADLGLVTEHGEAGALPALRRYLQQPKRWLLVFDNAETAEAVQPWVPVGVGHVLITSRKGNWPEFTRVTLELMTRRESVALLRHRVPELSAENADLVADKLGYLPLALVQAATVLSAMPVDLYMQMLDTDADEVLNAGLPPSYPRSLAAALRVSITELADDGEALHLLRLCCVMAPEPIPMEMLAASPSPVPEPLGRVLASPMRLYQTASRLNDLIRTSQRGIQVHRLVQTLILSQLDVQTRDELRQQASALVAACHPGEPDSAATWPAWSQLMPHLLALDAGNTDNGTLRDVASDAMLYLLYSGNTDAGFRLAERLYDQWRQKLGPDDPHTLTAAAELAHAFHNQGRDREALNLVEDTLIRRQRTLGLNDSAALRSASDHAVLLAVFGKLSESISKGADVLARRIAVLGADDRQTLATRGNLASWKGEAGNHQAAITGFEQLLTDQLRVLGPDHPDTLATRGSLARWKGEAGNHQAAITGFEQLLTDRLRVLGPDHPDTLTTRSNLATWKGEAGNHQAAITGFEQVLADRLRVLSPDHPDTLTTRSNLANWKGEAGNHHAAITEIEQLLTDQLPVLGPDHPDTLTTRGNLATWKGRAGNHQAAITGFEQVLADRLRVLSPDHPHTLTTRSNLASWKGRAGNHHAAIAEIEQLLTDQLRVLGPDHPDTLATRGNLAHWRGQAGNHHAAITEIEQLLTDQLRVLGPDHPHTLTTRGNLAGWKGEAGNHQAAITGFEQVLADRLRVLGPDHPDTLTTRGNLAHLQLERGAVLASRTHAMAKLEAERRIFGTHDHRTRETQTLVNSIRARMGGRPGARHSSRKKR